MAKENKKKKYTQVIAVKDEVKEAFLNYCEDNFLGQGDAVAKWMTGEGYLDLDGKVTGREKDR